MPNLGREILMPLVNVPESKLSERDVVLTSRETRGRNFGSVHHRFASSKGFCHTELKCAGISSLGRGFEAQKRPSEPNISSLSLGAVEEFPQLPQREFLYSCLSLHSRKVCLKDVHQNNQASVV
jgi:hypothetical protein